MNNALITNNQIDKGSGHQSQTMSPTTNKPLTSVTLIFSPYHVGIRDHAVGAGPTRIKEAGIVDTLQDLDIQIKQVDIPSVYDFEGDIGRSFEVIRRTAKLVAQARRESSFPVLIAGNCSGSVGVFAGLCANNNNAAEVGCIWFDAHDDYNTPDTVVSGYFDSMGVAIMGGECWKAQAATVPGFPEGGMDLRRAFVQVGVRDVTVEEVTRVKEGKYAVIWGGGKTEDSERVDYVRDLDRVVREKVESGNVGKEDGWEVIVHVDLDVLDKGVGQANKYTATDGGLLQEELVSCLELLATGVKEAEGEKGRIRPASLTVASYDPTFDQDGRILRTAINGIVAFVEGLRDTGTLLRVP